MIEFQNVTVRYPHGDIPALKQLSFHVPVHGFLFITGESGAGKTTILKLILKELEPEQGRIRMNGKELGTVTKKAIPAYRRQIGLVAQDLGLLADKTVYENVELVKRAVGAGNGAIRVQVAMALKIVGMDAYYHCYPAELSGGQQKRVCIARAIVNHPDILLADEPTGDLDPKSSQEIMNLLEALHSRGMTVIVVTHDREALQRLPYPQLVLNKGMSIAYEG